MSKKKDENFSIEDFNEVVDATIARLEEEKANAPTKIKEEISLKLNEVKAESTAIEAGEDEFIQKVEVSTNSTEREIIGNPGKSLVVLIDVETKKEVVCYGSAAEAARQEELNPTTVRTRCANEMIDNKNRQWKYETNEL